MKKLDDLWFGPFTVKQKIGASSHKLDIPHTWKKIHNVFHKKLLSPDYEPQFPNQPRNTCPPPEQIEGQEPEYEAEEILDSKG
jgi:hypothetical protein